MIRVLLASFASRKFVMTLFGLASLWLVYWKQVDYLYSFIGQGPEIVAAYVSITRDFMVAFTAAVLAYLGVNGVVIIAHGSSTALAVRNAIRVAMETVENRVNSRIEEALASIALASSNTD